MNTSVIRIKTLSATPPAYPATMPTVRPIGATVTAARAMIVSVIRLPQITRLRISRPSWSVPNQCEDEGGNNRSAKDCRSGSAGASAGARLATTISTKTMTIPLAASGFARRVSRP